MNNSEFYSPEAAFFRGNLLEIVNVFIDWQCSIFCKLGYDVVREAHALPIDSATKLLLPKAKAPITKHLFFETKSGWVGYLDNGPNGTDSAGVVSVLSYKAKVEAVRIVLADSALPAGTPDFMIGHPAYKAVIVSHHRSSRDPLFTMFSVNDGGRWKHGSYGEGDVGKRDDSLVDRNHPLSVERALQFCAVLGLRPADLSWYSGDSVLVNKVKA